MLGMYKNNKSMKAIIIFTLFCFNLSMGQNTTKIDSVFNRNFKIIDFELNLYKITPIEIEKNIDFFHKIDLGDGKFTYTNQYIDDAIVFFENITNIRSPIKRNKSSHTKPYQSYVDSDTALKWRHWYNENKDNLKWCKKYHRPILKCDD